MKLIAYLYCVFSYRSVQCALPVLDKSTVVEGEPFTIVCDHLRCDGVPENVMGFSAASIIMSSPTIKKTALAYILCDHPAPDMYKTRIPPGRNMKPSFHSNNRSDNRFIINVSLTVMDTRVEDSGQYVCELGYYDPKFKDCIASAWLNVSKAPLDTGSKDSKVSTLSPSDQPDEPDSKAQKSPPWGERTTKGAPKNHGHFIFTREIQEVVGCYFIWLAAWLR